MLRIGLTGNIASGKSIVESYFEKKGIPVINADDVCHELIDNDTNVITEIEKIFKDEDVHNENGTLSRFKIGQIVFSNPEKLEELEHILHPPIEQKIKDFFEKNQDKDIVVASVPLLFETGMQNMFDTTVLVCADKKIRLQRLMNRNGYSLEHAMNRINSQVSQEEKRYMSDYIIENNNDLIELERQINKIIERLGA